MGPAELQGPVTVAMYQTSPAICGYFTTATQLAGGEGVAANGVGKTLAVSNI